MMKPTAGTVVPRDHYGEAMCEPLAAMIVGAFAVHHPWYVYVSKQVRKEFRVTHVPTGARMADFKTFSAAIRFVGIVSKLSVPWTTLKIIAPKSLPSRYRAPKTVPKLTPKTVAALSAAVKLCGGWR